MDFSKYMIVTDLDGTFLCRGRTVPENMAAVAEFCAGGGIFTVATGRMHQSVLTPLPEISKLINAPAVVANGAYLYDFNKEERESEVFLPAPLAQRLAEFAGAYFSHVPCRASLPTGVRMPFLSPLLEEEIKVCDFGKIEVCPFEEWRFDDWYKLVFRDEHEVLEGVRVALEREFGDLIRIVWAGDRFLEIHFPEGGKENAVKRLRDFWGKGRILIACGDYENDLEMLKEADVGICPSGAQACVREAADKVLCDCSEGLIAAVVSQIKSGALCGSGETV